MFEFRLSCRIRGKIAGCNLLRRDATDIDYQLVVLKDCCADADEEVHRVLVEKVFPRQATVVTADGFVKTLG